MLIVYFYCFQDVWLEYNDNDSSNNHNTRDGRKMKNKKSLLINVFGIKMEVNVLLSLDKNWT